VSSSRRRLPNSTSTPPTHPISPDREKARQHHSLELIASENFTSAAVMECLGSVLTNKVSQEGVQRVRSSVGRLVGRSIDACFIYVVVAR
jgi:hypothetical protein